MRTIDYEDFDWSFLGVEAEAELFLQGGEDGWTVGFGRLAHIWCEGQFEIVVSLEAGLIDYGAADLIGQGFGEKFHWDPGARDFRLACVSPAYAEAGTCDIGVRCGLEFRTVLCHGERVDRHFLRLFVEFELKPVRQQDADFGGQLIAEVVTLGVGHLAQIVFGHCGCVAFGDDVVVGGIEPAVIAPGGIGGYLEIENVIGVPDEGSERDVLCVEEPPREMPICMPVAAGSLGLMDATSKPPGKLAV